MDITDLALAIYLTFMTTGISALFWGRMNRLDRRMDSLETTMREGFRGTHEEMAIMRSDLTHVALAVGAKPRASEG